MNTRKITAGALLACLLFGVAGCDRDASAPEQPAALECDNEDRLKNETPDCGFKHRGKFYEWSWVKAGETTSPAGWDAAAERRKVTG